MQSTVREIISSKYQERRLKNGHYSLRAFADNLGISSGALTAIVHGKRRISKKMAERLSVTLKLTQSEKESFLEDFGGSKTQLKKIESSHQDLMKFELISKWQFFALLSVLKIKNTKWSLEKISKKLNINPKDCQAMLETLKELTLIQEKNGIYFRSQKRLEFGNEVPNWVIKASHAESLELAKSALYDTSIELRSHSSMTLAVNLKNLYKAREKIRQFEFEMAELLEAGPKSEIYRLNVQLFPIIKVIGDQNEI